jgi:hypothetical protein
MFFGADLSLAAGKMRKNQLGTDDFRYDFTESQAASCKHFQSKSPLFGLIGGLLERFLKIISNCKGES